ncbi:MAG: hypothetical protein NT023_05765 [Armatimonadetes bacterium]|nr:hypothetical protein [Armatimonadota bacterium]
MLITTYNGVLVNANHVAFVALKKCGEERPQILASGEEPRHKVILFLAGGDPIVAADRLTRADAEFLRKEIAQNWAEGSALLDVATSLRERDAEETPQATP